MLNASGDDDEDDDGDYGVGGGGEDPLEVNRTVALGSIWPNDDTHFHSLFNPAVMVIMLITLMTNIHLEELMVMVVELRVGGRATVVEAIQMTSKTASTTILVIL